MKRICIYILPIVALLLGLSACRTAKTASASSQPDYSSMQVEERFKLLCAQDSGWEEFNIPLKFELSQPQKLSASGRLYMRRGSDILLSLRFIGMEVGGLYINSDSVKVVDKINRHYIAEPIGALFGTAGITVTDIQNILLGRLFIAGNDSVAGGIRLAETGRGEMLVLPPQTDLFSYAFSVAPSDNCIHLLSVLYNDSLTEVAYGAYDSTATGLLPQSVTLSTQIKNVPLSLSLKYNTESAKGEVGRTMQMKIPKGYTRLSADRILKSFTGS